MKSACAICVLTSLMAATLPAAAQFYTWEEELQLTASPYNDRDADRLRTDYWSGSQLWLFWDRELPSGRQIFKGQISLDGSFISGEQQFTFEPGENYLPRVQVNQGGESPYFLSWEHHEGEDRDIYLAYYDDNNWSDPIPVFDSEADEYAPWSYRGCHIIADTLIPDFIISAQKDSAVLLRRYEYTNGAIHLTEDNIWPMPGRVSNVTCNYGYNSLFPLAVVWQVTTVDDTVLCYRPYSEAAGWAPIENPNTDTISAFDPVLLTPHICFHWWDGDTLKYGHLYRTPGIWIMVPEQFPGFWGNQIEYEELLVSDINGNLDVFDPFGDYDLISLSDSDDQNPCLGQIYIEVSPSVVFRGFAFWESNRNDNWDIYLRLSADVVWGIEPERGVFQPLTPTVSIHPNPGNSDFRIDLELPVSRQVEAAIYDLSGRRVAFICDGLMAQGLQTFNWNATGNPSGIYLLRVESGNSVKTQKLVVLK